MWEIWGWLAVFVIGCFIELWTPFGLITIFFILFLSNVIIIPFRNKILWDNKRFKGQYVTAEIIYYDKVRFGKIIYNVTIINYVMNGKSIDALLDGKNGAKIGEKIDIITDGEVAFSIKKSWRDISNDIKRIILCLLFGYIFFKNIVELNIYCVTFCICLNIFLIIVWPITERRHIKALKTQLGWYENV